MDSVIKKRLIGALALGVLLLLALPVLFSGQGRLPEARITDIPPAPVLSEAPAVDPDRTAPPAAERVDEIITAEPDEALEPAPSDEPEVSVDSEPSLPHQEAEGSAESTSTAEEAWSVQMGSFSDADNARRFLDRIRDAGHDAYTRETPLPDGGTLTQVMAGPWSDQAEAREWGSTLSEEFDVSALVVRFRP